MLAAKRLESDIEVISRDLEGISGRFRNNSCNLSDVEKAEIISKNLKDTLSNDLEKLRKMCLRKDPETGDFVYKENFREQVTKMGKDMEEIETKVADLLPKLQQFSVEERGRLEKQEKEELNEKMKALEKAKRMKEEQERKEAEQREKEEQLKKQKEEEQLQKRKQEIAEEQKVIHQIKLRFDKYVQRKDAFLGKINEKDSAGDIKEELQAAVNLMPSQQKKQVLKKIEPIFDNIIKRPENVAFRTLNLENERFKADILDHSGSLEVLICAGFELFFEEKYDSTLQDNVKTSLLKLEEPDLNGGSMQVWKSWFDTQKKILEFIREKLSEI